jgi:hypothetical protein
MPPYHFKAVPHGLLQLTGGLFLLFVMFPAIVVVIRPVLALIALSFVVAIAARGFSHYAATRSRNW